MRLCATNAGCRYRSRWDDVVVAGEDDGLLAFAESRGVANEAFEPGELVSELWTGLRIAVGQVEAANV